MPDVNLRSTSMTQPQISIGKASLPHRSLLSKMPDPVFGYGNRYGFLRDWIPNMTSLPDFTMVSSTDAFHTGRLFPSQIPRVLKMAALPRNLRQTPILILLWAQKPASLLPPKLLFGLRYHGDKVVHGGGRMYQDTGASMWGIKGHQVGC
jgi:hypothetical protein